MTKQQVEELKALAEKVEHPYCAMWDHTNFHYQARPGVIKSLCERLLGMNEALNDLRSHEFDELDGHEPNRCFTCEALEKWGVR